MLDINYIRENGEKVAHDAGEKGYKIDVKAFLKKDEERRKLTREVEDLRRERNEIAAKMKGGGSHADLIARGKKVKEELAKLEEKLSEADEALQKELKMIPNTIFEDVPLGDESHSVEVKKWGENKKSGVDDLDFAVKRDWVDFERGAKVAGTKFYYLKGQMALLENALIQFGISKVTSFSSCAFPL